jgi:hypothetical protein
LTFLASSEASRISSEVAHFTKPVAVQLVITYISLYADENLNLLKAICCNNLWKYYTIGIGNIIQHVYNFRRLDPVSVFRRSIFSWNKVIELTLQTSSVAPNQVRSA